MQVSNTLRLGFESLLARQITRRNQTVADTNYSMICNALRTPDGTILQSRHRHDFKTYKDANGKEYMIDGGLDYVRASANGDEEMIVATLAEPHEQVREACDWGTYGINGDQPLSYITLSNMTTDHIEAVLKNVSSINPAIKIAMQNELEHRK